jgi:SSS family solute:Na+ symporter
LQLLGGIWILQTLPAVVFGLYRRWFHPWALVLGWVAGMVSGTAMAWSRGIAVVYPLHLLGHTFGAYGGVYALILNLVVAAVLTPVFHRLRLPAGSDETEPLDYAEDWLVRASPGKAPAMP